MVQRIEEKMGTKRSVLTDEKVQSHGYTPHIRPRGEEKKELEHNPDFRARSSETSTKDGRG